MRQPPSAGIRRLSVLLTIAVAPVVSAAEAPAPAPYSPAECAVWARELSFGDSLAAHDAAAFAEHLDSAAVFDAAGATPTRGREAIVAAWDGLIAGHGVELAWYPTRTTVGGDGSIAWSSGPFLMISSPQGGERQRIVGTFRSVWQKNAAGVWHVVYDAGGDDSRPATDDDVAAFSAGRRETCPDSATAPQENRS